ncbi:MAG TPA: VOC family protein [Stellaceae bacterium]|nr:VOC family protein [Stellaceae bacterium]
MASERPVISHVVVACFDFAAMVAFYTKVLGFSMSDIGKIRDSDLCFLTFDPESEHHQIALTGGRKGAPGEGALVHVCFRLPSYGALRARHDALAGKGVGGMTTVNHGSWLSLYAPDPEANKIEFRWDLPWYTGQPFAEPFDLAMSEDEIRRRILDQNRDNPRFESMTEWRAKALEKLGE